jgi:hypothetical protein
MMLIDDNMWDGSGEPILALVCGYPQRVAERVGLLMLQAYIDESGDGGCGSFVLAGYISSPASWARFSQEWDEVLGMRPRWDFLHMSEVNLDNPEHVEKIQAMYRIIEAHVVASVACVVNVGALHSIADEMNLPNIIRNPFWLGFQQLIIQTHKMQADAGLFDSIDFIFDERGEAGKIWLRWEEFVSIPHPTVKDFIGQRPQFASDRKVKPLQAADMYAWWVRRWWNEEKRVHGNALRYPWPAKVAFPRITIECHEAFLRHELTYLRDNLSSLGGAT